MNHRLPIFVAFLGMVLALLGATNYAGGWNDASRLATVESLVDRNTWQIDESIFVQPPPATSRPHPFGPIAAQFPNGTQDKLLIDSHFYSDKSPVPALCMAVSYQVYRWFGGPSAAVRPDVYCWFLSIFWAGGALVLAMLGVERLAQQARLSERFRLLVVASFAIGTIALPYSRSVNNHVLLLAATTWLLVFIDCRATTAGALLVGTVAGLAYAIDLGAGPVICLITGIVVAMRSASWRITILVGFSALPWIILHHALNYRIGGTIGPANANPEFFRWPSCPFNETNLTGRWPHRSFFAFLVYAMDMLIGKKGLFTHQPQLWLALAALVVLLRQRAARLSMLAVTTGWLIGVWLLYAATSRNQSGVCVSIRWFVPLLAPAYYWLIQALKFRPEVWKDLAILSAGGMIINVVNWILGPWHGQTGALLWFVVAVTGIAWGVVSHRRNKPKTTPAFQLRQAA